jgi:hypothetical protein
MNKPVQVLTVKPSRRGRGWKPRAGAKLDKLTEKQRHALRQWFVKENISFDDAIARIKKQFGLSVGRRALSMFWHDAFDGKSAAAASLEKQVVAEVVFQIRSRHPVTFVVKNRTR